MVIPLKYLADKTQHILASFPGLLRLQCLIACSILQAIKNWSRRRPGNEASIFTIVGFSTSLNYVWLLQLHGYVDLITTLNTVSHL